MSTRAKAKCPVCGWSFRLTTQGRIWRHGRFSATAIERVTCEGSGEFAEPRAA